MATKLILIRHGETIWNHAKRYCGHNDIGLSKKGRMQAKSLRNRMKEEVIHEVYTSDRRRAIETAKIIFNGSTIFKQIPDLREIHFGCFEGLTHTQILKKYALIYKKWLSDPYNNHVPEGERLPDFKKRVVSSIRKIISVNSNKTVAIVCHGGVISVFITHIFKKQNFWKYIPRSASLSIVEYTANKPALRRFNDTKHLT